MEFAKKVTNSQMNDESGDSSEDSKDESSDSSDKKQIDENNSFQFSFSSSGFNIIHHNFFSQEMLRRETSPQETRLLLEQVCGITQ